LLGAIGLIAALRFVWGVPIDGATLGLAVAAGALIFCLRTLYRMVSVLARPAVEYDLEQEVTMAVWGHKRLRDERRRLLRAINELKFDFEMGKLSEADYTAVRHGYEMQAVDVMRALDAEPQLHPRLVEELRKRGVLAADAKRADEAEDEEEDEEEQPSPEPDDDAPAPSEATADEEAAAVNVCPACDGANEADAKFCKHCGKELPK
jgi:hypothetical protein